MKIKKILKIDLFALAIVFITILLCSVNFEPGTWLSGWDTLHPEFDFGLNFKRVFDGVWREEQGLGAVAAHAHMADLPRIILLYFFSFMTPLHTLRYLYIFICLILGPLGIYFFLKHFLKSQTASFLGSLFYLFNLAALQHFYVPFEMFTTQYAALPWLFLFAARFIQKKQQVDLALFSLITLLAAPMAYAPQLWYVYFISLILYLSALSSHIPPGRWNAQLNNSLQSTWKVEHLVKTVHKLKILIFTSPAFLLILLTLLINSFWLLPHLYFLKNNSSQIAEAKINQLFSERAFLMNKSRAGLKDVAIFQGPLFDWAEFNGREFRPLMSEWKIHFQNPFILSIGYLFFALVILGFVVALKKKKKHHLALLPVTVFSLLFMLNNVPFIAGFIDFLRSGFTTFKEALRFPYTKFSLVLLFGFTFYFARANQWIIDKIKRSSFFVNIYLLTITLGFIVFMLPAVFGFLIDPGMKIKIPSEYFQMYQWFKSQPHQSRAAVLPAHSFWGWEYYNFGYQGAGFIWFGLPPSLLVRDFDRWNGSNENFYWEISQALYSQNSFLLEKVLEKYQVSWLILDENIISPDTPKALYIEEFKNLALASNQITLAQTFGKIKIYQVNLPYEIKDFKFIVENPVKIGPAYSWNNADQAFVENGTYYTSDASDLFYPFRSLFTGREQNELEFEIQEKSGFKTGSDRFLFKTRLPENSQAYKLSTPQASAELYSVNLDQPEETLVYSPQIEIQNQEITASFPQVWGLYSFDSRQHTEYLKLEPARCDKFKTGPISREIITKNQEQWLRLVSTDSSNCLDIYLPNLPHRLSYLVSLKSRNIKGQSLKLSIINLNSRRADIETRLPQNPNLAASYFILPPMEKHGQGYVLHFDNISIGQDQVINDLGQITVNQIPYDYLKKIKLSFKGGAPAQSLAFEKQSLLVYSQSFDKGWKAYQTQNWLSRRLPFIFGQELKEHILVNNWANGWLIPSNTQSQAADFQLVFWPQYFEYLGFVLLIPALLLILKYKSNSS